MTSESLRDIYRTNLGVRRNERVLVFTDKPSKKESVSTNDASRRSKLLDITRIAAEAGTALCREVVYLEYAATGVHGAEPPVRLWELAFGKKTVALLKDGGLLSRIRSKKAQDAELASAAAIITKRKGDAVDAVIALSNYSTSHTRFRSFLTDICGVRYASMPLFDAQMLDGPMRADWSELEKRTNSLAKTVQKAVDIELQTPNGTHISFSARDRRAMADTGIIRRPGSFSNLPAGEVYLAPVEGTAIGTLVLEWAPTRKLASPVTLIIRDGLVHEVKGSEPFVQYLRGKLSERPENANIAELGIGTNEMARRPDNILESEKIAGTVHIALGDNSSFGGSVKTPFHQDFVFFRPTLHLFDRRGNETIVLKSGRLITGR